MEKVYTKDKDGNFKELGEIDVNDVRATINRNELKKCIDNYWTDKKCGKHIGIGEKHEEILLKDLLVKPQDLFEQLDKNTFTFQNFGPMKLSQFLAKSKLDSYLKPSYLKDALTVTTPQPAIGQGEFLLVSCFKNINFSDKSGDLVDTDGNKIEVKGNHSSIGGVKGFKQMNKSIMFSIYRLFETNPDYDSFTMDCANDITEYLRKYPDRTKKVMLLLQNIDKESNNLANEMVEKFNANDQSKLLEIVAASHLFAYMKFQNANFLFALNDELFAGFKAPQTFEQAYDIIKNFKINGWTTGNRGISFTLKKE